MLCLAHTARTVPPALTSRNIPTICSSLNRLFFMLFCSSFRGITTFNPCPLFGDQANSHNFINPVLEESEISAAKKLLDMASISIEVGILLAHE